MMNGIEKPHVVAVPFPALGHSIPFLDFSKLLASHGLTVTYVTTPANASRLQTHMTHLLSSGLDIRLLVLPPPFVEGLPEGLESFELVPYGSRGLIYELADKLEHPFNRWLEEQFEKGGSEGTGAPVCIIHDLHIGWSLDVAQNYKIERMVFNTYGAFGFSLMHSAWLSESQNALEKEGDDLVLRLSLPGSAVKLQKHEIDTLLFEPFMLHMYERIKSMSKGRGMLINTFEELEDEYVQHLKNLTGKKVWPIGPVLPTRFFGGAVEVGARGRVADIREEELVQWLDSRCARSVVYISFGSQTFLTEEQSHALASGLEASEQPFIWSIKVPPKIEPVTSDTTTSDLATMYLPEGFQERTRNRGLVIWGWVPQLVILSHRSVGAFMSHCGWNSMLESVTLGVPLITWPMNADQHFNSKLAVDRGNGIQFCEHFHGIPDELRVKEAVKLVLCTDKGKDMRRVAENLKEMTRKAVEYGGSSKEALQDFVIEMYKLKEMTRKKVVCRGSSKAELRDEFGSEIEQLSISGKI